MVRFGLHAKIFGDGVETGGWLDHVENGYVCPCLSEPLSKCQPAAPGTAGDDGYSALQGKLVLHVSRRCFHRIACSLLYSLDMKFVSEHVSITCLSSVLLQNKQNVQCSKST